MKFQIESPMLSKSFKSLAFLGLTFLFTMYFAMKISESLIHLVSEVMCSMEPCKEIRWKLPLHNSGSVGVLGSYSNWMLMTLLSSSQGAAVQGFGLFGMSCPARSSWMGGATCCSRSQLPCWNKVISPAPSHKTK